MYSIFDIPISNLHIDVMRKENKYSCYNDSPICFNEYSINNKTNDKLSSTNISKYKFSDALVFNERIEKFIFSCTNQDDDNNDMYLLYSKREPLI